MGLKPLAAIDAERFRRVRGLILDVDGVLTDGRIVYAADGGEAKAFHVRDGSGLKYWHRAGHASAILSGRGGAMVERRAAELGIGAVALGAKDKLPALRELLRTLRLEPGACAYVGDDLPDIPPMRAVGLPLAVADAAPEVKDLAAGVTETPGGRGAVREAIEAILRAQGRWEGILARYFEGAAE